MNRLVLLAVLLSSSALAARPLIPAKMIAPDVLQVSSSALADTENANVVSEDLPNLTRLALRGLPTNALLIEQCQSAVKRTKVDKGTFITIEFKQEPKPIYLLQGGVYRVMGNAQTPGLFGPNPYKYVCHSVFTGNEKGGFLYTRMSLTRGTYPDDWLYPFGR